MIVAGIGSRKGVAANEVLAAIDAALAAHGLALTALIDALATAELKRDEAAHRRCRRARSACRAASSSTTTALQAASPRTLDAFRRFRSTSPARRRSPRRRPLPRPGRCSRLLGPRIVLGAVTCAIAVERRRRHDRAFHRRRAGRGRPHHRARPRPARPLPGLPLCRLDRAARAAAALPGRTRAWSTPRRCRSTRSRREYVAAHRAGQDVARLHSGDLSVWSAVAEQIRRLERQGIPYTLTPGVPSFAAAAAALGRELTIPEVAQSLVLTRVSGRASKMPAGETLAGVRRDRRDAGDPSRHPRAAADRRRADAALWRRLPGGDRRAGLLAGRAHRARHAGDDRGAGRRRADRAHRAHLRRPRADGAKISARARSTTPTYQRRFRGRDAS